MLTKFNDADELHHLREDDKIVHNKVASKGIVKLQSGNSQQLTVAEKIEMNPFLLQNEEDYQDDDDYEESLEDDEETAEGWAHRTLSKNKKPRIDMKDEYMSTKWIPCGTCEVERLFSKCKHIYSEFRKGLTPEMMEILLYLRVNRKYWDKHVVQRVVSKVPLVYADEFI